MSRHKKLPVCQVRKQILDQLQEARVLVITGETGSGKSTQIPQYILGTRSHKFVERSRMVGITQPRRVAAVTIAKRVAKEMRVKLGTKVGYTIRFEDKTSVHTCIKYMTDGIMLREAMTDPLLKKYSVLIFDEAHERTLHTDILFGLMKQLLSKRKDLRLVIMSATLDVTLFANYFPGSKILRVPGRQHPVEMLYTYEPQKDYLEAAVITVIQIHLLETNGDVLVFLNGQADIEAMEDVLRNRCNSLPAKNRNLLVLPIFAALDPEEQMRVFVRTPPGKRKVVLATNIAESSVTIPGIRFVVDGGLSKVREFNATTGLETLMVARISKQQALQRAGRAGREGPGRCFRLFPQDSWDELPARAVPELLRCNLSAVVLQLKTLGVEHIGRFDFIDIPSPAALKRALQHLVILGALDQRDGTLTKRGRRMSALPLVPLYAKLLLDSERFGCGSDVVTLVAMLSTDNVFLMPKSAKNRAVIAHKNMMARSGDHPTLINVFDAFNAAKGDRQWCRKNFVSWQSLCRARKIRAQLEQIADKLKVKLDKAVDEGESVRKCLAAACFVNVAKIEPERCVGGRRQYRTLLSGELVWLHPSSSLFLRQPQPEAVIYSELVFTSRKYIRCVTSIELHWLLELAPQCFRQDTRGGVGRENQLTHMTGYTSRGFYTSKEARDNESASNIPQLTRKKPRRR